MPPSPNLPLMLAAQSASARGGSRQLAAAAHCAWGWCAAVGRSLRARSLRAQPDHDGGTPARLQGMHIAKNIHLFSRRGAVHQARGFQAGIIFFSVWAAAHTTYDTGLETRVGVL